MCGAFQHYHSFYEDEEFAWMCQNCFCGSFSRALAQFIACRTQMVSSHDLRCFDGIDADLKLRFSTRWLPSTVAPADPTLDYLRQPRSGLLPYRVFDEYDYNATGLYKVNPWVPPPPVRISV